MHFFQIHAFLIYCICLTTLVHFIIGIFQMWNYVRLDSRETHLRIFLYQISFSFDENQLFDNYAWIILNNSLLWADEPSISVIEPVKTSGVTGYYHLQVRIKEKCKPENKKSASLCHCTSLFYHWDLQRMLLVHRFLEICVN